MRDQICEVISYCASTFAIGKMKCTVYCQIVITNVKRRRDGCQTNFTRISIQNVIYEWNL